MYSSQSSKPRDFITKESAYFFGKAPGSKYSRLWGHVVSALLNLTIVEWKQSWAIYKEMGIALF